jgi:hypothetical protein
LKILPSSTRYGRRGAVIQFSLLRLPKERKKSNRWDATELSIRKFVDKGNAVY